MISSTFFGFKTPKQDERVRIFVTVIKQGGRTFLAFLSYLKASARSRQTAFKKDIDKSQKSTRPMVACSTFLGCIIQNLSHGIADRVTRVPNGVDEPAADRVDKPAIDTAPI